MMLLLFALIALLPASGAVKPIERTVDDEIKMKEAWWAYGRCYDDTMNTVKFRCINALGVTRQCTEQHGYDLHLMSLAPEIRENWLYTHYLTDSGTMVEDLETGEATIQERARDGLMMSNGYLDDIIEATEGLTERLVSESLAKDAGEMETKEDVYKRTVAEMRERHRRSTIEEIRQLVQAARRVPDQIEEATTPPMYSTTAPRRNPGHQGTGTFAIIA